MEIRVVGVELGGVDDALAILMAHAHADVVALTIAAGNVGLGHTVGNALRLVEASGAANLSGAPWMLYYARALGAALT